MIPLKLHIKNFVSYGPTTQTIDFAPYHLICLSGKNGHGKSALLDALTWALWGQARKVSGLTKADEGLMRLGQTQMMVSLDFLCNGINYRVRREFSIEGKGHTNLEFGIIDPTTATYKALTDKTIKATQTKIETMIGLDYESFINSAFLRQGQSNEFSKKSPKDRKEVLATILGLNQFERLRKKASDKSKEAAAQREYVSHLHTQLKSELSQKNNIEEQLNNCKTLLNSEVEQESNFKILLSSIKEKQIQVNIKKEKYNQLCFQIDQLNSAIEQQKQICISNISAYRSILRQQRQLIDIDKIEGRKSELQLQLQAIHENANKKIQLKEQLINKKAEEQKYTDNLIAAFNKQYHEYEKKQDQENIAIGTLNNKINDINKALIDESNEIKIAQKEFATFKENDEASTVSLEKIEKQFEKRKACYQKFIAQGNWLKNELTSILQKKQITNSNEPICPTCQQNISDLYKEDLCNALNKKERLLESQVARLVTVTKQLKILLVEQHALIELEKKKIELNKIEDIKKAELQKRISKIATSIEQKKETLALTQKCLNEHNLIQQTILKELSNITELHKNNLANNNDLNNLRLERSFIESELDKIIDNKALEESIQKELKDIALIMQNHANTIKESAKQEQRKEIIYTTSRQIKQKKREKLTKQTELLQYASYNVDEMNLSFQETQILKELHQISSKKEQLISLNGGLERQLLELEKRQQEFLNQEKTLKLLQQTTYDYNIIAQALSKDGIQALLIEDALPEIEHEANILLARLTDNTAQISLESLRDLRSGGTKETLDIKISDPLGIRAYELFSGGEAFRIDFALRIAISKLLARRAGTALQTLIIDEGFGSQDEEGLSHIMEAIHAIGNDFCKVIIVSHLPAMKDQFPVHFFVSKGSQGSTIKILENA